MLEHHAKSITRRTNAYKCTAAYDAGAEGAIRWDDPDIGIDWPPMEFVLSDKDRGAPLLRDIDQSKLPAYR